MSVIFILKCFRDKWWTATPNQSLFFRTNMSVVNGRLDHCSTSYVCIYTTCLHWNAKNTGIIWRCSKDDLQRIHWLTLEGNMTSLTTNKSSSTWSIQLEVCRSRDEISYSCVRCTMCIQNALVLKQHFCPCRIYTPQNVEGISLRQSLSESVFEQKVLHSPCCSIVLSGLSMRL